MVMMTREEYYAQIKEMYAQKYESPSMKAWRSGSDHFERSGDDRWFSEEDRRFREYLMSRNDDDDETWTWTEHYSVMDDETDWWYRSEKEDPEDQSLDDGELVETEVVTESDGIEQQTVNNEENANENLDILKEESITQIQVPVSSLESSLQIHNASPTVCEDSQYVAGRDGLCDHQKAIIQVSHVKARDELLMNSKNVTNNQDAHHLFDKMSLRVQSRRGHIKCQKTWRFKFKQRKQQRGKLRSAHQLIHRGNVMYKSLCSSAKVALMKKNKFSITRPMLKDECFIEDDQVSHETLPLWLLIRSKFRKFKFRNKNFQKMMREHGHFSHLKLKSDMGEDDEMFTGNKAVSMRFLLCITPGITENNAGQGQQAVFEQIKMVNEWQHQISLVLHQVMRSKKFKFLKRWMFKYKAHHLDTKVFETSDQGTRNRVLVGADRLTKNNQPTLRSLMNTKQSCQSLRANRVWDPGGSLVDAATPRLLSLHFTVLHLVTAILSSLQNLEVKVSSKEGDLIQENERTRGGWRLEEEATAEIVPAQD